MHPRRVRQRGHRGRFAASLITSAPLPAFAALPEFAADSALSEWGTYLFFAIVATVVIVLLLHEALENHPPSDPRCDERAGDGLDKPKPRMRLHDAPSRERG
jgi:hypothetical protein